MVRGRYAQAGARSAGNEVGQVTPGGDVNGDVVKPSGVMDNRPGGIGVQNHKRLAARTELKFIAVAGDEGQPDDIAPNRQRAFGIGDRNMNRAHARAGRQERSARVIVENWHVSGNPFCLEYRLNRPWQQGQRLLNDANRVRNNETTVPAELFDNSKKLSLDTLRISVLHG